MRRIDYLNNSTPTPAAKPDYSKAVVGAYFKAAYGGENIQGVLLKEYDNRYHVKICGNINYGKQIYIDSTGMIVEISKENFYENFEFI